MLLCLQWSKGAESLDTLMWKLSVAHSLRRWSTWRTVLALYHRCTRHEIINVHHRCLEGRQGNTYTTQLAQSHFSKKNWLPQVGFEPMILRSLGDALTTKLPRQLSWLGQITNHTTCTHEYIYMHIRYTSIWKPAGRVTIIVFHSLHYYCYMYIYWLCLACLRSSLPSPQWAGYRCRDLGSTARAAWQELAQWGEAGGRKKRLQGVWQLEHQVPNY